MRDSLRELISSYDAAAPLERAWTIPAGWYFDQRIAELERHKVLGGPWQAFGPAEQVAQWGRFMSSELAGRVAPLNLGRVKFVERHRYELNCNWKVYVDNYLDGGYHVPHLHKGLNSVLEYRDYTIENGEHFCVQASPMRSSSEAESS